MRQIQPWLPSFSSEFRDGVPLTRAGAIAQRPDVPEPLREAVREEIVKKLMRNAGPEGLYTAEGLLRTVEEGQSSGAYPVDFVEQLQANVQELRR